MLFLIPTAAALLAGTAKADTITFEDNYGTVTGTGTDAADFDCGPTTGVCWVHESGLFDLGPIGEFVDTPFPSPIYIGDAAGDVSAELVTDYDWIPVGEGYALDIDYYFTGGLDLSTLTTCASEGGCQITEDGTLQYLGETTFDPATGFAPAVVDFQYTAPEPASVQLFLAGLVGLAGWKLKPGGRRRGTAV
jgi:hypothetical protein